jgi:hypothetical protein
LNWLLLRLIREPFTFESSDSVESWDWKIYYIWTWESCDIFISRLLFSLLSQWKLEIEIDTIFELNNHETYSSAVYLSIFYLDRNLLVRDIRYLNLRMLRLIHRPFSFQSSDFLEMRHWKRYYTRTYLYSDFFSKPLFSKLLIRWKVILKDILYLNLVLLRLIHEPFTFESSDLVKIRDSKRYCIWTWQSWDLFISRLRFSLLIQWKLEIEIDTINELSYG